MVRIGIVGAGGMGTVHYNNYAHIKDGSVIAMVGKSPEDKERAAGWGVKMYGSITEMVNREPVDLVDICTPTFLHKQQVMESLSLGRHTIVEKPAAMHQKDVEEMFALAEQKGVQLYVAQVLQFTNETAVLRNLVQSREYGQALDGYFERLSACPHWTQNSWMFDAEKSGLIPFDLHVHDLDLIVSLFGVPEESSFTCCAGSSSNFTEQYRFQYRFGPLNVCAEAAWFHANFPFTARWRVYFENAVVVNNGTQVTAYPYNAAPRLFDTEEKIKIPTGINVPPTGWYLTELTHFVRCAEQNMPSPLVKPEQVAAVIGILEKTLVY